MANKKTVFSTDWFSIESEENLGLGGKPFYSLVTPDGIAVLAYTDEKKIVIIRQFRPALDGYTLEFPAGQISEGEDPASTAVRELYEETGYICKELIPLSPSLTIMGNRSNARMFAFLGFGASRDQNFIPREDIEVLLVTFDELKILILEGKFSMLAGAALVALAELHSHILQ